MNDLFRKLSHRTSRAMGSSGAFVGAVLIIAIWATSGPLFHYSDTWQLVINTGTTIVTFLMVFLIQNTQNRDAQALHLKLDELIRAVKGARQDIFIDLEDKPDAEVERVRQEIMAECDVCSSPEEHSRHVRQKRSRAPTKA
jgi:low affinity Fe/Cu permease